MLGLLKEVNSENKQAEQAAFEQYCKDEMRKQLKNVERTKKALADAEEYLASMLKEEYMREKFNKADDYSSRLPIKDTLTQDMLRNLTTTSMIRNNCA